jgi:ketosteroid isomerase-like protein
MSRTNVEVVQHWLDAYNRRDIDGLIALADRDIEFRSMFVAVEPIFRGYEGIRTYFDGLEDAYDHFQVVPIEFIDAGAAVLWMGHFEWRGKESGAGGTTQIVPAQWLRAGKVFRIETFTDRTEALEAVGLTEEEARVASSRADGLRS